MTPLASMSYLMYHEIELPGRSMCHDEPGYQRYVVREKDFAAQMNFLKQQGRHGQSVGDAIANPFLPGVAITFDDGCETDLITAGPLLCDLGFRATFYITVGFLGRRGYLSRTQLRELASLGHEIGSHSMTHPYLSDLSGADLSHEIADSRKELANLAGVTVDHFSCPGGRWSTGVMSEAKKAGYRTVATSEAGLNFAPTDAFRLGRIAIMRGADLTAFSLLTKGKGLWKIRAVETGRSAMKQLMGNDAYDRTREKLLRYKSRRRM